jgi:hypothetical protein
MNIFDREGVADGGGGIEKSTGTLLGVSGTPNGVAISSSSSFLD